MILAQLVVAACPTWAPGDSQPVYLPPGCHAPVAGMWRTVEAENLVAEAAAALNRCATGAEKCAAALRDVPEPVSRVEWALLGAGAAAVVFLLWTEVP